MIKMNFIILLFLNSQKIGKLLDLYMLASSGSDKWFYTKKDVEVGKKLLPNFTGLSFREKGMIKLVEKHFNLAVKPVIVLDPTLLIDKNYYLNEIQNYKRDFNFNEKYIFVYQLDKNKILEKVIYE